MRIFRSFDRHLRLAGCVAALLAASASFAAAQGKLDARYVVTVAGVPVGKGSWVIDIAGDQYTMNANGRTTGLLQMVSSGEGIASAHGALTAGKPVPTSYAINVRSDKKAEAIRIALSAGMVKNFTVDPVWPPSPDRVPVTEAHKRGVLDPLSAALVPVAGNGDPVGPEACHRTVQVFDGRMRFDLTLTFKRMDRVKSEQGYQGPVAVCMVTVRPIAGHRPGRPAIKFLTETRDIEVWLAPLAGTRFVVPYRISVPTFIGQAVLQATQFVTAPPSRADAAAAAIR